MNHFPTLSPSRLTARPTALLALLLAALALAPSLALAQSPPGSVSSVTLTRADGTVTADWPAVSGATKYHVTYTTNGGASWSLAASEHTTNSITISNADNTKTYIVGVRAGNDHGWSGWKNSPSAGPYTLSSPPGSVSSVTLTRADGTVTADWPAVSGATKYHATYTTNGGASWSLAALEHTTNSITISSADNTKTYTVGVRAGNDHGWSGWVNSSPAGPYTPPPAKTDYDTDDDGLIEVSSGAQLDAIRYDTDGNGTVSAGDLSSYQAAYPNPATNMGCPNSGCIGYELSTGLDLSDWDWIPIDAGDGYSATFDGNDFTISNLYIDLPTTDDVGLFGSATPSAFIRNVVLSAVSVTGRDFVGSLVGSNYGTITDSTSSGHVAGSWDVGGLVGVNHGAITDSTNSGHVTGNWDETGGRYVGGLVGSNLYYATITDSTNSGHVTGDEYVGGLVGSISGSNDLDMPTAITGSTNSGNVTGNECVGGLVGINGVTITDSTNSGHVTGSRNVGGLVGGNHGTITGSTNSGRVTGIWDETDSRYVGGLVGSNWNWGIITNSTTSGNVTANKLRRRPGWQQLGRGHHHRQHCHRQRHGLQTLRSSGREQHRHHHQ